MIDRRKFAWLIFGLIYGKARMELMPNIGEPFGHVVNGQLYISPVWYEALRKQVGIMPGLGDPPDVLATYTHEQVLEYIDALYTYLTYLTGGLQEVGILPQPNT